MACTEHEQRIFERTASLLGPSAMEKLSDARVILFGVGGVGSWCAEALVRSGIRHLTIVDDDVVAESNVNRQLMATSVNIGKVKVEELRSRLLQINPDAEIVARYERYCGSNAAAFDLDAYDYVLDCIDSLKDKISLVLAASASKATLFSSMGAARKTDPCQVRVAEFWKVRGCPLGAMMRKRMRQRGTMPAKPFMCVYDEEVLDSPGTLAHITGIFGLTLAGLVIKAIVE
jgi:tRNA A37 threonylcarbamoyladenosine dehydratase